MCHVAELTSELPCCYVSFCLFRDGGLKREKVKDTFKEEQQKLYSKMIVGNHEDRSRS
jgi:hypothetical protein